MAQIKPSSKSSKLTKTAIIAVTSAAIIYGTYSRQDYKHWIDADKDPSDWMPPNPKYQCQYIKNWIEIKKKWQLIMDEKEKGFVEKKNEECNKAQKPASKKSKSLGQKKIKH